MDIEFLQHAIHLAETHSADGQNGPFGAVIAKDDAIIAEAWNQVIVHQDPTAHAEIVAIRQACQKLNSFQLRGCTLYASCEPCPMCLAALYWVRIDAVVYAASKEDAAEAGFDDLMLYDEMGKSWQNRKIKAQRLLESAGRQVLKRWRQNPNRIEY
ncbi:nucleoside deaminase [candidate division KSB1 bacterium]|nr:nucleoside deaminase [candidate division KSB1 bacterium]RQW04590.1 MAG: nucleoside deaminase [candidate division KSB1 bacterium]